MKIFNYRILLILIISGLFLSSCKYFYKKEIEPVSELTTYPIFVLEGNALVTHTLNEPWTEPGFHCSEVEEGADDLTASVVVDDSQMDVNTRGLYTIFYTASNSYGYERTVTRNVLVTEPGNLEDISGTYSRNFGQKVIEVSPSGVEAFWRVDGLEVYGKLLTDVNIADLGDKTYIIARHYLKRRIDLLYVYIIGDVEHDATSDPDAITFHIIQILENGTPLSDNVLDITYEKE